MDKLIAGLLGTVAGLATIGTSQASTVPIANSLETKPALSYAELLAPIPDAAALLKADDAARAREQQSEPVQVAQVYYNPYYSPYYYNYYNPYYGSYYGTYYRRYYHHHHHHHHHNYRRR